MSRRHRADKREIIPDPKFGSRLLSKFICKLMLNGKKALARRIVYGALESFANRVRADDVVGAFEQAVENVKPSIAVKSRRVGGATYQVPVEIHPEKRISIALKWIIRFARIKPGRKMEEALALELTDSYNNQGASVKKRDETHRTADSNKAFAHYKW